MNSIPKYVVSDSLSDPTWNNTTVVSRADFPALARDLKQKPGQDIVQYGYGPVTAVLLREGLLDELRIWLHPITVGGRPAAPSSLRSAATPGSVSSTTGRTTPAWSSSATSPSPRHRKRAPSTTAVTPGP
jgi:dihydrofolate reductase